MPTRLCTYVVRDDTGLAPNPYWNFCTLAVCTPNHQGTRLKEGDWIAGVLSKARGYRLLYTMQVEAVLDLDTYFHDERFAQKKPNLRGSWKERCGDNFYSKNAAGQWIQHRNRFHLDEAIKKKDVRHARAFVGTVFSYFGREAIARPERFATLFGGRGARVNHDAVTKASCIAWLKSLEQGLVCEIPNDNPDLLSQSHR